MSLWASFAFENGTHKNEKRPTKETYWYEKRPTNETFKTIEMEGDQEKMCQLASFAFGNETYRNQKTTAEAFCEKEPCRRAILIHLWIVARHWRLGHISLQRVPKRRVGYVWYQEPRGICDDQSCKQAKDGPVPPTSTIFGGSIGGNMNMGVQVSSGVVRWWQSMWNGEHESRAPETHSSCMQWYSR